MRLFFLFFYLPYSSSIHEKAMHRYVLDAKSALAWELLFPGHLFSTQRWGVSLSALPKDTTSKLADSGEKNTPSAKEAILNCYEMLTRDPSNNHQQVKYALGNLVRCAI